MNYPRVKSWLLTNQSICGGVFAFLIFLIIATISPSRLHFEISNNNGSAGEIYLNTGSGYEAGRAIGFTLMPDRRPHAYTINMRSAFPRSIRIDPGTTAGDISVRNLDFENALYTRKFTCDDFLMLNALTMEVDNSNRCVLTAAYEDPYFDFPVFNAKLLGVLSINWRTLAQGFAYALLTWLLLTVARKLRCRTVICNSESWICERRSINLYAILSFGFISFLFLNINASSLKEWSKHGFSNVSSNVIFGESRAIRSDEWLVATPFMASQTANNFYAQNPSLGSENSSIALVATVPVRGIYGYSQPRFWGFYTLGFEKGLAWLSGFRVLGLLLSGFILFSIITKGDFWLSLMASGWLALSPFTQWWFFTNLPDMIIGLSGGVSSLYIIINAKTKRNIVLATIALFFSGVTFVSALYPAFLIPLFYLALFLVVGLILRDNLLKKSKIYLKTKIISLFVAFGLVFGVFALWYLQANETISLIQQSAYPGKRVALGGDFGLARIFLGLFSPFFGMDISRVLGGDFDAFASADRFPISIGNIFEASGYILLFPIAWLVMVRYYWKKRKIDVLSLMLSAYIALLLIWMMVGFPEWLAVTTKMAMSPTNRSLVGLGLASILLVVSVFSKMEQNRVNRSIRLDRNLLLMLAAGFAVTIYWLNLSFPDFLRWWELAILVFIFSFWGEAFVNRRRTVLIMLTLLFSMNGFFVNPLTHGVASLQDSQLANVLKEEKNDGAKQWMALPNLLIPQYLKANGASVWNGVRFTSNPEEMYIIDPEQKFRKIWFRYAHFSVESLPPNSPPEFILKGTDTVVLRVDLCSEYLRTMGINRFAFMTRQSSKDTPCLIPIRPGPVAGIWLYKSVNIK